MYIRTQCALAVGVSELYDFGKFEVKDYNYRNHLDGTTGVTKRISFSAYKKFKDEVKEKCK